MNDTTLVATALQPEQLQDLSDHYPNQVTTLALDVTNRQSIQQAVEATHSLAMKSLSKRFDTNIKSVQESLSFYVR